MFIVQATDLVIEKDAVDSEEGLHRSTRDDLLPDFGRPRRDGRSAGFSLPPVGNVEEDLNLAFYQDGFHLHERFWVGGNQPIYHL